MNPRIIRFAVCALRPLRYSKIVLAEGIEPTCNLLPFLLCIRQRGYASILGCLMGVESISAGFGDQYFTIKLPINIIYVYETCMDFSMTVSTYTYTLIKFFLNLIKTSSISFTAYTKIFLIRV